MQFSFTLLHGWNRERELLTALRGENLLPHQLLLMLSDGSLTTHLEAIYDCTLTVEIRESGTVLLEEGEAAFLGVTPGGEAVARGTWLKAGGKKLVYAKTLLPVERLDERLIRDVSTVEEPLVRLLTTEYPFSRKERIEIGIVASSAVAGELDVPDDTPFWMRRYRLTTQAEAGERSVRAMVTELFSPELMGTPLLR
ncbi:MAG: chorismate--pyruvate lyase family protein [Thermodesulfobacteriota bacterium]